VCCLLLKFSSRVCLFVAFLRGLHYQVWPYADAGLFRGVVLRQLVVHTRANWTGCGKAEAALPVGIDRMVSMKSSCEQQFVSDM